MCVCVCQVDEHRPRPTNQPHAWEQRHVGRSVGPSPVLPSRRDSTYGTVILRTRVSRRIRTNEPDPSFPRADTNPLGQPAGRIVSCRVVSCRQADGHDKVILASLSLSPRQERGERVESYSLDRPVRSVEFGIDLLIQSRSWTRFALTLSRATITNKRETTNTEKKQRNRHAKRLGTHSLSLEFTQYGRYTTVLHSLGEVPTPIPTKPNQEPTYLVRYIHTYIRTDIQSFQ